MSDPPPKELVQVARIGCADEFNDYTLYERLSQPGVVKNETFATILRELAETERTHFEFWKKFVPDLQVKPSTSKIYWVLFLKTLFGITFAVRYLYRHEGAVIKKYKSVAHLIPPEDQQFFNQMISDEEGHEKEFSQKVESASIQYISFIVLGLADALVEITGIHAGSLGIYNSTEIAGLAGIIAGAAASLAMSSAAFAQAKQGFKGSARRSAVYTGVSYFVTAVILATPYFLTKTMTLALFASLVLAVIIVSWATYYGAVISGKPFRRDFIEILSIMFGTTVVLYLLGYVIRVSLGITI
ncbi:MAG: rubrerythrin family protein [Thaumarchaeota archaeon]|nr:rubrerythrin family protein [Nitrososphaerota archaeon]